MTISTRTPEGEPNECPVCGHKMHVDPSRPPGDAPCPKCGTLLWFPDEPEKILLTAWDYGRSLIEKGEIAAGLEVLQNVVAHRPRDVGQRRKLRQIELSIRAPQEPLEKSAPDAFNEVWWEIRQAKHKRALALIEWDAIDRAAERGLAIDPRDVELHLELGHACRARGFLEVARFAYQCALEIMPERPEVRDALKGLAES